MIMSRKRTLLLMLSMLLAISIWLPLTARGASEHSPTEQVVTVTDSRGITLSLRSYPQRIVSLSPNITETIFALGGSDRLVGITDYCDYPEATRDIPTVGDLLTPNVERIVALEPDLVIISNLGQLQTIEAIERTGIPVSFIDEPESMEGTYEIITKTGLLIGKAEEAQLLIESMQKTMADISGIASEPHPTVYYVAGFGEWGDFTATGDTFIHDIITRAGGDNIASDAVNWSFQLELLHAYDPDIIILPPLWGSTFEETLQQFVDHPSYAPLSAVQAGRIITIDNNIIERQGPRSAQAAMQLAEQFLMHAR